jgi:predicted anti-sigma-YlaC factor YlaD
MVEGISLMNTDLHERARRLIALSGVEEIARAEQGWLAAHLDSCVACREFAENSRETVRMLRAIPFTADERLVSATKKRVRQRAQELQRREERIRMVWVCCAAVTLGTGFTTAVLWRGFEWIGRQGGISAPLWEIPFAVLCFMPGILAGILLLARGTHLVDRNGWYPSDASGAHL